MGIISFANFNGILKKGISTEGIIFSIDQSGTSSGIQLSYPTVRFLTINNEWVTETSNVGLFPGYYKSGEKVTVVYKPENPKKFIIKSNQNKVMPAIVIIAGITLLCIGLGLFCV